MFSISFMQGAHRCAQKSTSTTLPRYFFELEILAVEGLAFQEHFIADEFQAADVACICLTTVANCGMAGENCGRGSCRPGAASLSSPVRSTSSPAFYANSTQPGCQRRRVEKLLHLVESFAESRGIVLAPAS